VLTPFEGDLPLTDLDVPALLAATRAGESRAFAELYRRYRGTLMAYAERLAGPSDAEDLVSEAMAAAWRQLKEGAGPERSFLTYVKVSIRNQHLNRVRRPALLLVDDPDSVSMRQRRPEALVAPSAETTLLERWQLEELRRALDRLPAPWRRVLVRTYLDGLSWIDVADELQILPGAARQLGLRARHGLAAELAFLRTSS
jgi:RNA polymerase sigma factor (sigma-70 family)